MCKNIVIIVIVVVILLLFFVYYIPPSNIEKFIIISKNKRIPTHNNIWMYWENMPNKTKPNYLKLCFQTILYHCKNNFNIYLLNDKNIHEFIPNLRLDLDKKLKIQPKTDYLRYYLLELYGGIWIDADTIIMNNLQPIIKKLKDYDFVGFGCHYTDRICQQKNCGYPKPANWVMASRKNGKLMTLCRLACDKILDNDNDKGNLKKIYFTLGRNLIWSKINYLEKNDKNWKYYHYHSKCIERDYRGNKLRNERSISNEEIDKECINKYLFIPIYNTAPGFPSWFIKATIHKIINSNMLISKLLRHSLNINY